MDSAISSSVQNRREAAQGNPPDASYSASYEDWVNLREPAVYYIQNDSRAPVWVGEFGTTSGGDGNNHYWNHMLRYYEEHDVNWCYWALDPIRYPKDFSAHTASHSNLTFGVFDVSRKDYWAVVGWKLQALIGIMQPKSTTPAQLMAPAACVFEEAPNLAAVQESTSVELMHETTAWPLMAIIQLVFLIALAVLIPCICICVIVYFLRNKNTDTYSKLDNKGNNQFVESAPPTPRNSFMCCGTGKSQPNGRTIQ
jgi:hypothetical protein